MRLNPPIEFFLTRVVPWLALFYYDFYRIDYFSNLVLIETCIHDKQRR